MGVRVGRPFGARRRSPVRARLGDLTNKHSTQTLENHYLFASGPAAGVTVPPPVSVSGPCGWSRAQEDQYLGAFCKGLEGSTQLFIIRFVQSYARAYAHAYPHTPTRIRMRTHTCSSCKQTGNCGGGLSLPTLSSEERRRRAPFLTVLADSSGHTVLVEVSPSPCSAC